MIGESEPVPKVRPTRRQDKDKPATPFHNWYDAMAFLRLPTLLAPERKGEFRHALVVYFAAGDGAAAGAGDEAG